MKKELPVTLIEWGRCPPLQWPDRQPFFFDESDTAATIARKLTQENILSVTETRNGIALEASSFVGRIHLGPLKVTVQPKIDGLKLFRLLRYAYGLRDLHIYSAVDYAVETDAFQEILLSQLAMEAEDLVNRGLQRKYLPQFAELSSPRGRIAINQIAARGGITGSSLPCRYHPREVDCLPNQILAAGLFLGAKLCENSLLRSKLRRLGKVLRAEVSPVRLDHHAFQRLERESNRLVEAYQPSFRIIKLLLQGQGLSLDSQETVAFDGFMFDMNRFFQALLSRFLKEYLAGYQVRDEFSLHGMMHYQPGCNPRNRRSPCPRPDFAVLQNNVLVRLLDAKYRDLWDNSLPRDMLYQLSIYSLSQPPGPLSEVTILYPSLCDKAQEAKIVINDPLSSLSRGTVVLRPVNLDLLEALTTRNRTYGLEKRATAYANYLIFGGKHLSSFKILHSF